MKNIKPLLVSILILVFCSPLSAQPDLKAAKVDRNVIFGMYSGLALLMDVYYPEISNGYGVIHISGSGWTKPLSYDAGLLNHQGHVSLEGEALVAAGYTLFSINHRAVPRFIYPAAVEDAQRAVRYIRYNAKEYGINPDRIGAVGGSSGGHLVCMLGMLDGDEVLEDETPVNQVSAKVQCVIARAAPTDFTTGDVGGYFIGLRNNSLADPKSVEYKRAIQASPITYVTSDDPPTLLVHGDKDEAVPFELSIKMEEKLKASGVPTKLIRVEGAGHGPNYPGAVKLPDLQTEYVRWLDTYLKIK